MIVGLLAGLVAVGAGAFLYLACSFLLVGIGFFNESFGLIHLVLSIAFFVCLALSILLVGAFMLGRGMTGFGVMSLLMGAIAAFIWLMPWRGAAIPEAVSARAAGVWSASLGFWMLRLKE